MARKPPQNIVIAGLLARYSKAIRDAFMAAIARVRSTITLWRVTEALKNRDLGAAVEEIHFEMPILNPILEQIRLAYLAGGENAADQVPKQDGSGLPFLTIFDIRHPIADAALSAYLTGLALRIRTEQVQSLHSAFAEGMRQGLDPAQNAVAVIGRINRATGRREGGVIGLSAPHTAIVTRTREDLASGDPQRMARVFNLKTRERRFDKIVQRAIKLGQPVSHADVEKIVGRLADGYLKLRADTIGHTEAMTALNSATLELLRQVMSSDKVDSAQTEKEWRTHLDGRERHTHHLLDGQTQPADSPFLSVSGATLKFPGDPDAPVEERVNCRCWLVPKVVFVKNKELVDG